MPINSEQIIRQALDDISTGQALIASANAKYCSAKAALERVYAPAPKGAKLSRKALEMVNKAVAKRRKFRDRKTA